MALRFLSHAMRTTSSPSATFRMARSFQTSSRRLADAAPLPAKKPVGAFRGGLFGFLLGSTLTGAGIYYYFLDEYMVANEALTDDITGLQRNVQRVHDYVRTLEEKLAQLEKKK
ncbi:hypothetical protein OIDMADRAFT_17722, partial [Oidiodendron maius Zn]